jgi:hypothetical protein
MHKLLDGESRQDFSNARALEIGRAAIDFLLQAQGDGSLGASITSKVEMGAVTCCPAISGEFVRSLILPVLHSATKGVDL